MGGKAHKLHLASDRISCSKATANQFRLVLHTAAYCLLHNLRGLVPKRSFWPKAQLDTLRLALIEVVAGSPSWRAGWSSSCRPTILPGQPHVPRRPGREPP